MALEKELETYNQKLPELLSDQGKFVLICEDKIIDIFFAYEDALKAGYEKCGVKPFLVKKILAVEQAHYFSRPLNLCLI